MSFVIHALAVIGAGFLLTLLAVWASTWIQDFILWRRYRRALLEQDWEDREIPR